MRPICFQFTLYQSFMTVLSKTYCPYYPYGSMSLMQRSFEILSGCSNSGFSRPAQYASRDSVLTSQCIYII